MLTTEIEAARKNVVSDGYDMSIGEIANLYRDKELKINPNFQRLFRWNDSQKTAFIESLLLGIPTPPVFVFQNDNGIWELIDGLQRLSTIFEFMGILIDEEEELVDPSVLSSTNFLPSLADKTWDGATSIGQENQLVIKRARMRVEILKKESDENAKYELFQRLNTGGANLSEQEVRNCTAIMINEDFYEWMKTNSESDLFLNTISVSENQKDQMFHMEQFLKFISLGCYEYEQKMDVHEYLATSLIKMTQDDKFNTQKIEDNFRQTFQLIYDSMGNKAFKRFVDGDYKGQFLVSSFESVSHGVSRNLDAISKLGNPSEYIATRVHDLWSDETFKANSGAGVRGTTRLTNLVPHSVSFFKP